MMRTALLPRFGVTWTAEDEGHITAHDRVDTTAVDLKLTIDVNGLVRSIVLERWGDPDNSATWAWHPFGGEILEHRTFGAGRSNVPGMHCT